MADIPVLCLYYNRLFRDCNKFPWVLNLRDLKKGDMKKMEFDECCGCHWCEPEYDKENSTICTYGAPDDKGKYPRLGDVKNCPKSKKCGKNEENE